MASQEKDAWCLPNRTGDCFDTWGCEGEREAGVGGSVEDKMSGELFISYFPIDNSVDDLLVSNAGEQNTLCSSLSVFFMQNDTEGYGIFTKGYALGRKTNSIHSFIPSFIQWISTEGLPHARLRAQSWVVS